jgi:glycosyltransferase involved in cell wall biosynthesis
MINVDDITIVIPCKNEKENIIYLLDSLYKQKGINNINIIISDSSNDNITVSLIKNSINNYKDKFNIKIINGGYPSVARLNGSLLVKSEYMLFIDSDIYFKDKDTIIECFKYIKNNNKDLLTIPFKTEDKYNIIYVFFDFFQKIGLYLGTSFAVGGFQLWNINKYWKVGGYNSELIFAEDYWISSKINKNKFIIYKKKCAYTYSRRFKSKGIFYMFKLMILSYINRNNIEFFKKSHNYWK